MNNSPEKKAGLALIIFTILLVLTMLLHPAGGSVEHLIRITRIIVITHAIAILSLPFGLMGFWGLTKRLGTQHFGSQLGFAAMSLGLVAVMIAAAVNGLVMPIFIQRYHDATPEIIDSIRPVLQYSFSINHAFDFIYTGAFALAMLCWSFVILTTKRLPAWLGWAGIALSIIAVIIAVAGAGSGLLGFRLFVSSIVIWILLVGVILYKMPNQKATAIDHTR